MVEPWKESIIVRCYIMILQSPEARMVLGDKVLLPYRVLVIISTSEGKVLTYLYEDLPAA